MPHCRQCFKALHAFGQQLLCALRAPAGFGGGVLAFASRSRVGGRRAVGGPPHGEVGDGSDVGAEAACGCPRGELGGRQRVGPHTVGEVAHELVASLQVVAPVAVEAETGRQAGEPGLILGPTFWGITTTR